MRRNSERDDRRRERLAGRQRQVLGYAITAELGELEAEILRLLASANGRRSPPTTLGVDDIRLAVAAVAWGTARWAWVENDYVYPKLKTFAFVARGCVDDKVAIRILSIGPHGGGPDTLLGENTWVHHRVDRTIRSVDPATCRWTMTKFDHNPSEAEILEEYRFSRTGHGFVSNLASAERLVRLGHAWSLEAARAFSSAASKPAPLRLSEAWELAAEAYRHARSELALRDWLAFPYDEAMRLAGTEVASRSMDDDLTQWTLRCALPSRIAEDQFLASSSKTASFRKDVVSRSFEAAKRFADSVAPLDPSRRVPLVLRPIADWTFSGRASRNPDEVDRLRRRADAGDPDALRRYRAIVEARARAVPPWEDVGFSKAFHEVLEDLRPGSSSKKDVSGWGDVIPDMYTYVGRALNDEPYAPRQRLVAGGIFTPHPDAARELAWLHGSATRPPLAGNRELVAVAYVLGWKHKGTEPVKGVAMSLVRPVEAAALEARVVQAGCLWVSGIIYAAGPKEEWGRRRLFVEGHHGEPLHESGRRSPGSERTG